MIYGRTAQQSQCGYETSTPARKRDTLTTTLHQTTITLMKRAKSFMKVSNSCVILSIRDLPSCKLGKMRSGEWGLNRADRSSVIVK